MALTNVGIFLMDVNTHVLLRSSEIVWTVAFAWLIQHEVPSLGTIAACLSLLAGTILVSLEFGITVCVHCCVDVDSYIHPLWL